MDERTKKSIEEAREKYAKEYVKHYSDGKPYLPFKAKLAMFREVFPFGSISVSCARDFNPSSSGILATATIYANVESPGHLPLATAFAQRAPGNLQEDEADSEFNIYEIAESAAISKALSLLGMDLPNSYLAEQLKAEEPSIPVNSEVVSEFVPSEIVNAGQVEDVSSDSSDSPEPPPPAPDDNEANETKSKKKAKKKSQSSEKALSTVEDTPNASDSTTELELPEVPEENIPNKEVTPDNTLMNMSYEWRNRKGFLKDLVNGNEADHIFLRWLAKEGTPFAKTYPDVHEAAKSLVDLI